MEIDEINMPLSDAEEIVGYFREQDLKDPVENDQDSSDRWPEFPGLKDSDIMSSTITIKLPEDADDNTNPDKAISESILRGVSNVKAACNQPRSNVYL